MNFQQTTNDNFVLASIKNLKKNKVVKGIDPSPSFSGTYIVPFEQTFRGKAFYFAIGLVGAFIIYRVLDYIDKRFPPSAKISSDLEKKEFLLKIIDSYNNNQINEIQTRFLLEQEDLDYDQIDRLLGRNIR